MTETTMLAGRLTISTREFSVERVPVPEPARGEVRVKVGAAGVCLSDVHLIEGLLTPSLLDGDVVTLGHEVSGTVDTLGADVTGWAPGDRVVVKAGHEKNGQVYTMGVDYDGGWAEYLVAPADNLVAMPDDLPFEQGAIIPDAVSTPWSAIETTAQLRPGDAVGVWGVGGLGVHAVQLLRFAGAAPIIAIDPLEEARTRAADFGADVVLDPGDPEFREKMRDATSGRGLDVAFDFAGVDAVRAQAISSLGVDGRLVLVGLSGTPITIANSNKFTHMRKSILGHYGSEPQHVDKLVELTRLGRIEFSRSISGRIPLAEAAEAVRMLEHKEGNPIRLVLVP
ncbi:zinc-binding dehydrogenase [Salinibacterium sp. SYSU T00001]|uniref:zinc-binding dehydrogenase n=1 Tax=Homoserinimonas sedimenticola TaxID=2986805 RepID=UPI002235EEE0|nr:zinc-binding dehydrogenase [Salinibacterium sedimenticola]MCW4385575.1 zinc-binding dehydrogenase [Salinibacterium sedimenticola]